MWSTTARGRRRRCCSSMDRGPRAAPGVRWSRHSPTTTTSSGVDLPGCGQSPPAPYDVPVQAGRVAALLSDLGLRRLTVAGHSSGGYVATALAEQRPGAYAATTDALDELRALEGLQVLPTPGVPELTHRKVTRHHVSAYLRREGFTG